MYINGRKLVDFYLNHPQAKFLITQANESWLLWGRGTGKTQGAVAPWVLHKVEVMPGSCGAIIGQSFADLRSKILKPLFTGFQMLGHKMDEHYVFGKKPPDSWDKPLIPIIDFSQVISFPNGTTVQLVSLHQKGSANSNSFQWMFGPEAKFFNPQQMEEIMPTLRGLVEEFGDSPWYGAKLFETDKLSPDIHWILKKRELHNEEVMKSVIFFQLKVNELRLHLQDVGDSMGYKIRKQIGYYEQLLVKLRKNLVVVIEASAMDNIANLRSDYFDNMKRSLSAYEYSVAIENEDPTKVEGGYYPDRAERHLFLGDYDDVFKPLAIALDYQASISPLVSAQLSDKLLGVPALTYLNNFYVTHPKKVKDVIREFCLHHVDRPCKEVIYFYDHTAVGESGVSIAPYQVVINAFKSEGWKINAVYMGQAPSHEEKYDFISEVFREESYAIPPVRLHKERMATTIMSMDLTPLKDGMGTQKDKSSERNKKLPQELATHFGDTFDMLLWAVLKMKLYPSSGSYTGNDMAFR